jgi:hypothetical protein
VELADRPVELVGRSSAASPASAESAPRSAPVLKTCPEPVRTMHLMASSSTRSIAASWSSSLIAGFSELFDSGRSISMRPTPSVRVTLTCSIVGGTCGGPGHERTGVRVTG